MLWQDQWGANIIKDSLPELYSFARKPKCSLSFFIDKDVSAIFFCPLSSQDAEQLTELSNIVDSLNLNLNVHDSWHYSWGTSIYSSTKSYRILMGTHQASPLFKRLWKSGNLGKHRSFFWLLLNDRLNTRNILRRKKRHLPSYNCVFCNPKEKTCFHLFFECPFSTDCWNSINLISIGIWDSSHWI